MSEFDKNAILLIVTCGAAIAAICVSSYGAYHGGRLDGTCWDGKRVGMDGKHVICKVRSKLVRRKVTR